MQFDRGKKRKTPMCGYCVENIVLNDYLNAACSSDELHDNSFCRAAYLQVAEDWYSRVLRWPANERTVGLTEAFCRYWDDYMAGATVPISPWEGFDAVATKIYADTLRNECPGSEWEWVVRFDEGAPKELPVTTSIDLLQSYVRRWLRGGGVEDAWTPALFAQRFPFVFLALAIVIHQDPGQPLVHEIALSDPHTVPAFDGWELWLQRQALAACVRHGGLHFVQQNYDDLRLEALAFAILSGVLDHPTLTEIQKLLDGRAHWTINIGVEDLQRIIQLKLSNMEQDIHERT